MNPIIFWKRKPILTALWLIVLISMTIFLSMGFSLFYTTWKLPAFIEENNKTVALIGEAESLQENDFGYYNSKSTSFTQENYEELSKFNSVKDIHINTITGAYSEDFYAQLAWEPSNNYYISELSNTYNNGIVIGKISYIRPITTNTKYKIEFDGQESELYEINGYEIMLDVENLFLYNDVYTENVFHDFKHVTLNLAFYSNETENFFKIGDRYIFYIDNYRDGMNSYGSSGPSATCSTGTFYGTLGILVKDDKAKTFKITENITELIESEYTIDDSVFTYYTETIVGFKATTKCDYIPIASKIEGSLEEFLSDPANDDWETLFTQLEIINGCLPVIGTDCLEGQYAFVTDKAKIIDGRFFTDKEYKNGEKVIIINKFLAEKQDLKVGDKIKLSQFLLNEDAGRTESYYEERKIAYSSVSQGSVININPTIGDFISIPKFATIDEDFTIVGIYAQSEAWTTNMFAFTPNTVFIPKSAQISGGYGGFAIEETSEDIDEITGEQTISSMVYRNGAEGVGLIIEIKNGMMDEFNQEIAETKMEGNFLVFDQGYEESIIPARLLASMGRNLFIIIFTGWVLVLVLFVLLYQLKQNNTLGIMRSIGATSGKTRRYIFACGIIPAVLGVIIGSVLSALLIKTSQNWILSFIIGQGDVSAESGKFSQMLTQNQVQSSFFIYTAIIQIIIFAVILWLCGYVVAKRPPRKLTSK